MEHRLGLDKASWLPEYRGDDHLEFPVAESQLPYPRTLHLVTERSCPGFLERGRWK